MKMQPSAKIDRRQINASQRISALFLELLERQFPIDENNIPDHCRTHFAGVKNSSEAECLECL
jgi:hypothetical protein